MAAIDMYIYGDALPIIGEKLQVITPWIAFSLGLFSGFSPCHMAILAFILAASVKKDEEALTGLSRATAFWLGLMDAYMVLGLALILFQNPLYMFTQHGQAFTMRLTLRYILIGLNLMDMLKLPFSTRPLIKRLARPTDRASSAILSRILIRLN